MKPVIFTIPGINWDVPGFGLMMTIAFLTAIWWATRRAVRSGANPDVILNLGFVGLIAGAVGCRAMYVIHYWDQFRYRGNWLDIAWAVVDVRRGGLEFYGGFVLTVICVVWWLWRVEKVSLRWYLDIVAPSAALGLAIGRIGCFLNGCCFGGVCDLPWAVTFPYASNAQMEQWKAKLPGSELPQELLYTYAGGLTQPLPRESLAASDAELAAADAALKQNRAKLEELEAVLKKAGDAGERRRLEREAARLQRALGPAVKYSDIRGNLERYGLTAAELRRLAAQHRSLPVHPAQLYSTVTALVIAFFLNALYWRRTRDGQVICTLLLIEAPTRFLLEMVRTDNPHDVFGLLTISQFIALCMMLAGLIGLLWLQRLPPRSPRAATWEPPAVAAAAAAGR